MKKPKSKLCIGLHLNPDVLKEIERLVEASMFWDYNVDFIREAIREKLAWEVHTCHFCLCEAHKTIR